MEEGSNKGRNMKLNDRKGFKGRDGSIKWEV